MGKIVTEEIDLAAYSYNLMVKQVCAVLSWLYLKPFWLFT